MSEAVSPQYDSLSSENTVVENTPESIKNVDKIVDEIRVEKLVDIDDDLDDVFDLSPGDIRTRKGSYTLDHPSPVLVAYMNRRGRSSMETPR